VISFISPSRDEEVALRDIMCVCERSFEAEVPEEIDLDRDDAAIPSILDGTFLSYRCPACGKLLKPEFTVFLHSDSRKTGVFFLPESERGTFYAGAATTPPGSEVVIGYPELLERVREMVAGLDPRPLEIMKFFYLQKAEEKCPEGEIRIFFHGIEADALVFHIHGMAKDEIAVIKAPRSSYDRTVVELPDRARTAPYASILAPPYISIRRLDVEEE
jgi:hypothetical protein